MTSLRFALPFLMLPLFALVLWAAAPAPAPAQEFQQGRAPLAYVREVLAVPVVNYPVVLTGYLVRKAGDEKYLFQDNTGSIQASIPQEALYNITVDGKRLTVRGIVDMDADVIQIRVESVTAAE